MSTYYLTYLYYYFFVFKYIYCIFSVVVWMSATTNAEVKVNTEVVPNPVPQPAGPTMKKIDARALDLQQNITNFALYYGDISKQPSVQEQRYESYNHFFENNKNNNYKINNL